LFDQTSNVPYKKSFNKIKRNNLIIDELNYDIRALEEELNQDLSKMYPAQREAFETITRVALSESIQSEQKLFFIDGPGRLLIELQCYQIHNFSREFARIHKFSHFLTQSFFLRFRRQVKLKIASHGLFLKKSFAIKTNLGKIKDFSCEAIFSFTCPQRRKKKIASKSVKI
jgi:hypothetical protein